MASGGNKNKKMSDETRRKMSESAKNRDFKLVLSDETKKILSEKAKERFNDDNERERLRIANKGMKILRAMIKSYKIFLNRITSLLFSMIKI